MSTIPADLFVEVTPSVLSSTGGAVDIIGLILTQNTRVPIGTVMSFPDEIAVADFFGPTDPMATLAEVYFAGYENATAQPGAMYVTQYPLSAVSAYLRGGDISALPLTTLQGYNATLNVTIDNVLKSATINLSGATSFSNAAEIIANALTIEGVEAASVTATLASTLMTVTGVTSGTISVGDVVSGTGITSGTYIASFGTGTGGAGTYNLSASASSGSGVTVTAFTPAVQYDSVSGAFVVLSGTTGASSTITFGSGALATDLLLTQATGAVLSQGAAAATPAAFMTNVLTVTTDWATFMTAFDPDNGSGNTQKQAFAAWNTEQDDEFAYICFDTDITPTEFSVPATGSLGYILQQNGNSGTCPIYEPTDLNLAAFVCGAAAAINFNQAGGRITFAFKSQAGLTPSATSAAVAVNLGGSPQVEGSFGNGYNYYGAIGAANAGFQNFQRGTITGPFKWLDSYINQIWLDSLLQVALLNFLASAPSVPFNQAGAGQIENALAAAIAQGLSFGAYAPGALNTSQINEVNTAAGSNIAGTLQTQGYYLQVLQQPASVRQNRGPWAITFFYLDRGSVQSISLNSIAIQ